LAKARQHTARKRRDFHHNAARKLLQAYDVLYHEILRVANMVSNQHLAKSIQDAGWSAFLVKLACKAANAGQRVQAVNPAFTSQRCSGLGCEMIVQKGLSVGWQRRPECGTNLHRDHNAALNLLRLGQALQQAGIPPSGVKVTGCPVRSLRTRLVRSVRDVR
jgi:putative transposase